MSSLGYEKKNRKSKGKHRVITVLSTLITIVLLILLLLRNNIGGGSSSSSSIDRFTNSLFERWQGVGEYVPDFHDVPQVEYYDLLKHKSNKDGWQCGDRIVFCVPLRDAAEHLPRFFKILSEMTYPHNLIDLTFLVSDSKDNTMGELKNQLNLLQSNKDPKKRFGMMEIYEKDFGQVIGQSFSDRHSFAAQGPRRKLMARARNWLGSMSLKPYHSWVYWRDVDVEVVPNTIMEDLMHHDKDIIVPNVWRPLPDWLGHIQPYDLNSWKESEGGLQLAEFLDEDAVIVEGYAEYATWRPHLAYMRDPSGDPELEMELDGIGGVSILTKARVFRSGSHFPAFSFEKHAETEAFGKISRKMGFSVVGLPNYVVWHIFEPSSDDLKHMQWMADEEKRILEENKLKDSYQKIWDIGFEDVRDGWRKDLHDIMKNTEGDSDRKILVDWTDDDTEKKTEKNPEKNPPKEGDAKVDSKADSKGDSKKGDSKGDAKVEPKKDDAKVEPKKDDSKTEPKKGDANADSKAGAKDAKDTKPKDDKILEIKGNEKEDDSVWDILDGMDT